MVKFLCRLCLLFVLMAGSAGAFAQAASKNFDHVKTGFALSGMHTNARCESCHINGTFKGTPRDCATCHVNGNLLSRANVVKTTSHFQTTLGCDSCHTTVTFGGANSITWVSPRHPVQVAITATPRQENPPTIYLPKPLVVPATKQRPGCPLRAWTTPALPRLPIVPVATMGPRQPESRQHTFQLRPIAPHAIAPLHGSQRPGITHRLRWQISAQPAIAALSRLRTAPQPTIFPTNH